MPKILWILLFSFSILTACGQSDLKLKTSSVPVWQAFGGDSRCFGGGYRDKGYEKCSNDIRGTACPTKGTICEITDDDCNGLLKCMDEPVGLGPISQRQHKEKISYLSKQDLAGQYQTLREIKLARYRYKWDAPETERLGFIIDDIENVEQCAAVTENLDRVDLYGYVSMAVAAIQVQTKEIENLKAQMKELKQMLSRHQL